MGNHHRAQAQFDRAKWRAGLLTPLWALQLTMAMTLMGLFSWRLGGTISHYKQTDEAGKTPTVEIVWQITNIAMSFITALCVLVELARYFSELLTPWTMLFTNVINLTCASAILALDVVIYVQRSDVQYTVAGLVLDGILMITSIFLAAYAIRAYRRLAPYDDYAYPANVKQYGFADEFEPNTSYSSKLGLRSSMERSSFISARLSVGSVATESVSVSRQSLDQTPRRYSHERDTQFEEYMMRRVSAASYSADPERGFGRSSPPRELPGDATSLLGHRSRGSSVSRVISLSSDHVLVAVPEEEGEVADAADQHTAERRGSAGARAETQ